MYCIRSFQICIISQLSGVPTAISVFDVATESFNTQKELDEVSNGLLFFFLQFHISLNYTINSKLCNR